MKDQGLKNESPDHREARTGLSISPRTQNTDQCRFTTAKPVFVASEGRV
jgi:hypothetical protein